MIASSLAGICVLISLAGCGFALFAARVVRAFGRERTRIGPAGTADVTVLKPLHGAEPRLYENLMSFVMQDYPGAVQVVFGVDGASDGALPIVRRLMRDFPHHDLELVIGSGTPAGNAKIANLVGMSAAIRHGVVVLSDSDMQVKRNYLQQVVAALDAPDVGLVTCLYRGEADSSPWGVLASMAIDFHFFPSVLLGLRLKKAHPCMGATMAFRSETLAAIGGFAAFSRHLADDHAIGEAVRATGKRVAVARQVVVHRCSEAGVSELFFHELRWARTLRAIDPRGFAGSFVTNPLPFAFAAAALLGFDRLGCATLFATVACRAMLQRQVERTLCVATQRWMLMPVRDVLTLVVFVASFAMNDVVWRGHHYRVADDGTVEEPKGSTT